MQLQKSTPVEQSVPQMCPCTLCCCPNSGGPAPAQNGAVPAQFVLVTCISHQG